MSNYVNDALLDASPYKKQQDEAKALVNKWDKTGLLDGLNEDFQRSGMAVMLENQARQLILHLLKMRNGQVLHFHWFVESLVKSQLKSL